MNALPEPALADDDTATDPPGTELPDHPLTPAIVDALKTVYDPEIPVNIYEIGLIYRVTIAEPGKVHVDMTLTSPMCPVAGEMPGMVKDAIGPVPGVDDVSVEIVWDPPWSPALMSETAKLELNMW